MIVEFLPNERRNFVHKRILGAVGGFIGGGPLGAIKGFVTSPKAAPQAAKFQGVRGLGRANPNEFFNTQCRNEGIVDWSSCGDERRRAATGRISAPSQPFPIQAFTPQVPTRGIVGAFQRALPGGATGFTDAPVGDAVMGRYGAALVPGSRIIDRAVCLRGMILANDGLCYNRSQIKNSEREYPRGRRPLLTGGDMRAISIASRAANRLTRTAVRLQDLGLIKKPVARRLKKKN